MADSDGQTGLPARNGGRGRAGDAAVLAWNQVDGLTTQNGMGIIGGVMRPGDGTSGRVQEGRQSMAAFLFSGVHHDAKAF